MGDLPGTSPVARLAGHADVNATDEKDGNTPLLEALNFSDLKAAACLLGCGTSANQSSSSTLPSPLAFLAQFVDVMPESVRLLFSAKADVNAVSNDQTTCLEQAVMFHNLQVRAWNGCDAAPGTCER